MITSRIRYVVVALICLLISVEALSAASEPADTRLRALADNWLGLLDSQVTDDRAYASLLVGTSLDLSLLEGQAGDVSQLSLLLKQRFESVQSNQHSINYFHSERLASGHYQLSMVVDWQLYSANSPTEIASLDLRWLVREADDGRLLIEQIRERYLPPLQSMGARIEC